MMKHSRKTQTTMQSTLAPVAECNAVHAKNTKKTRTPAHRCPGMLSNTAHANVSNTDSVEQCCMQLVEIKWRSSDAIDKDRMNQ